MAWLAPSLSRRSRICLGFSGLPDFVECRAAIALGWCATVAVDLDDVVGGGSCHGRADIVGVIRFESGNRQEMMKKLLRVLSYGVGGVEVGPGHWDCFPRGSP